MPDGQRQFHSVKRQATGMNWPLYDLTVKNECGRSIPSDLFAKLAASKRVKVAFVSATTPNELNELIERASRCSSPNNFKAQLNESPGFKDAF